jgi:gliding motility-associated-like protein
LATGTITVTAPTGTGLEYSIDGTIFQTTTVFAGLTANSYTVTVKNAVGCTSTLGATVNAQPASPAIPTLSVTQPTCTLTTGTITVTAPTGTGLSYSIDGTTFQSTTAFAGLTANNYTVTVRNAVGCTSALGATVNAQPVSPAIPTLSVTQPTCILATGTITVTAPTGTGLEYSIDGTNFQTTTAFAGLIANSYTITVKNAAGCTRILGTIVNAQPASPATPTLSVTQPTCALATGTITVNSPVGSDLVYSIDGSNFQPSVVFNGLAANNYMVSVKSSNGCITTAPAAKVNAQPPTPATPVITANSATIFCEGGSVTLSAPAAAAYQWSNNATSQKVTVTATGVYYVKIQNAEGCWSPVSSNVTVTVNPYPVFTITSDKGVSFSKGTATTLTVSATGSINWTPATGLDLPTSFTPVARPLVTTTYKATVTSNAGCATSNDITLTLIDDYKVTPKKIVTLNGDGVNDYFVIENIEAYPNNLLQIFDRSGKLVYEKRQYHNDWNGVVRNRNFINDTYFYVLYIDDKIIKKGSITIIK